MKTPSIRSGFVARRAIARGLLVALALPTGPLLALPPLAAESLGVDGSELFDEDARRVAGYRYFGSKRGGSGAT